MNVALGTAELATATAGLVDAGRRVGQVLHPSEPEARWLVAVTGAAAAVVVGLEVLGTAHWLFGWALMAWAASVWAVTFALTRRRLPTRVEVRLPRPASGRGRLVALAGVALVTLVAVAVIDGLAEPRPQFDALLYHLPIAVQWLQAGNTWLLPYLTPVGYYARYPANFELLELWTLVPLHRDFLVQLATVPGLLLAALGTAQLALSLGARRVGAWAAALVAVTLPPVLINDIGTDLNDLFLAGTITAAAAFTALFARRRRPGDLVMAGLALGLAVGAKDQGLVAGLPVAAIAVGYVLTGRRRLAHLGLMCAPVAVGGAYFYVRNALRAANPLYPLGWSVPGHRFPAPDNAQCCIGPSWITLGWHPHLWVTVAWHVLIANLTDTERAWGPMLAVLLLTGLAAPFLARRGADGRSPLHWWWALLPAAELVLYLATPLSAGYLGLDSIINIRFALTAALTSAALGAALLGRLRPAREQALVAVTLVAALGSALVFSTGLARRPHIPLLAGLLVGLVGIVAVLLPEARRPALSGRATTASALLALPVALIGFSPWLARHYLETSSDVAEAELLPHLPPGPVDLVDVCLAYSLYGPRLDRQLLDLTGGTGRNPPLATTYRAWTDQLDRAGVTSVVVAQGQAPCFPAGPVPQAAWAAGHPEAFPVLYRSGDGVIYGYRAPR